MSKNIVKIVAGIVAMAMVIYAGYQILRFFGSGYRTETTYEYAVEETMAVTGLMIREEWVYQPGSGVVVYTLSDGARIGKRDVVANIYENERALQNWLNLQSLEREISLLKASNNAASTNYTQVEYIGRQITACVTELSQLRATGSQMAGLSDLKTSLTTELNRRLVATGVSEGYAERIAELEEEHRILLLQIADDAAVEVKTEMSGYFCSSIDGFETLVTPEDIEGMSVARLNTLIQRADTAQRDDSAYKILPTYTWQFAIPVAAEDAGRFTVGRKLTLRFPFAGTDSVPVTVSQINEGADGSAVVVLTGNYMSENFSLIRAQTVQIVFRTYSGLRVDNHALRFEGTEAGVLVEGANRIYFRKIDKIYEGAGFIITSIHKGDSSYVQLFDEVIVEGKNVEAGMVPNR